MLELVHMTWVQPLHQGVISDAVTRSEAVFEAALARNDVHVVVWVVLRVHPLKLQGTLAEDIEASSRCVVRYTEARHVRLLCCDQLTTSPATEVALAPAPCLHCALV